MLSITLHSCSNGFSVKFSYENYILPFQTGVDPDDPDGEELEAKNETSIDKSDQEDDLQYSTVDMMGKEILNAHIYVILTSFRLLHRFNWCNNF